MSRVAGVTVQFDPGAIDQLLYSPQGAVARNLQQRAIRVESQAKVNASGRPGPNVQTGLLRSRIGWRLVTRGYMIWAEVYCAVYYAYWVEMGSRTARAYPYLRPALSAAR